jgi:hypothetical protein
MACTGLSGLPGFHLRRDVPPLSRCCRGRSPVCWCLFPRSEGRGSIEALLVCGSGRHCPAFPRSEGRGSIEAGALVRGGREGRGFYVRKDMLQIDLRNETKTPEVVLRPAGPL